jgi:hypothetical protein
MLPAFAALREAYAERAARHAGQDGGAVVDTLDNRPLGAYSWAAMGARAEELADKVEAGELT